jgi:4'-phosphopantetheinyl transferase
VHACFRATDALSGAELAHARQLLSDDERARAERFVFERDRRDFTAAHALLRSTLSRYADVPPTAWRFETAANGKPFLAAQDSSRAQPESARPELRFNLSHTHGLVACVVADGCDVGIDVESIDRRLDLALANRFFSAVETAWVKAAPPEDGVRRFLELWTLKEAYLKAIGKGLWHPLDTVIFEVGEDGDITFRPPPGVDAAAWQFALSAPAARYRLAVAVRRPTGVDVRIEMSEFR